MYKRFFFLFAILITLLNFVTLQAYADEGYEETQGEELEKTAPNNIGFSGGLYYELARASTSGSSTTVSGTTSATYITKPEVAFILVDANATYLNKSLFGYGGLNYPVSRASYKF